MMDMAIIGSGPAGWSCAITARLRGLSVMVIAPQGSGGWLEKTERIDNYPGMPQVSGRVLLDSFAQQGVDLGVERREGLVRQIMPNGEKSFMLLVGNEVLECRSVVLAMGAARPKMLPGEDALLGQGISYCATCDGMFYRDKRVAVLSASLAGFEEARFLATLAKEVDYFSMKKHQPGELPQTMRLLSERPEALLKEGTEVILQTQTEKHAYDGVFIFREAMPLSQLLSGLDTRDGYILVDRSMSTNVLGVFAAGDCTGKPWQIAKAVGEGNIAAISAAEYIGANG
ncbi:MAG: NAD(P)/FAD-dependent oxidoreductase [Clostridiales bacterium]|nr:NAD(P)/FAD-dependent oxidoreductase [Clostridiales bacterium]